jgi:hypothetical protein
MEQFAIGFRPSFDERLRLLALPGVLVLDSPPTGVKPMPRTLLLLLAGTIGGSILAFEGATVDFQILG